MLHSGVVAKGTWESTRLQTVVSIAGNAARKNDYSGTTLHAPHIFDTTVHLAIQSAGSPTHCNAPLPTATLRQRRAPSGQAASGIRKSLGFGVRSFRTFVRFVCHRLTFFFARFAVFVAGLFAFAAIFH